MREWSEIPGFEGQYEVSNDGIVRSWRYGKKHLESPRILRQKTDKYGYLTVTLQRDGEKRYFTVHRLVAAAFVPNPKGKPQVNHKNGIKKDNSFEDLEWATNAENIRHAFDTGLISKVKVSEGQKRRYQRPEERELSRKRTVSFYSNNKGA